MSKAHEDRPLSYWRAVSRMGFENDLARLFEESGLTQKELAEATNTTQPYVSRVLGGTSNQNFTLETMAKFARAVKAIVQIRLVKEGREFVRVVDRDTAAALDDISEGEMERRGARAAPTAQTGDLADVLDGSERFVVAGTVSHPGTTIGVASSG